MQFSKGSCASYCLAVALILPGASPAPPAPRLSIADWGQTYHEIEHEGKGTYAFGYDVDDPDTGNTQFRDEERHSNGSVTGSYGLLEPDGRIRVVHYIADDKGFRVRIISNPYSGVRNAPMDTFGFEAGRPELSAQRPEWETEALEPQVDLNQRDSLPPQQSDIEPNYEESGSTDVPESDSKAPSVVISGGFIFEVPPTGQEEVSPTQMDPTQGPGMLNHQTPLSNQLGAVLFHPHSKLYPSFINYSNLRMPNYYITLLPSRHIPWM